MADPQSRFDDLRAVTVTDTVAAVTLVAFALLLGGGLGLGIAFPGGGGGNAGGAPSANFSYEFFSESNTVFVTLESGGPIPAGHLVLVSGEAETTWAVVADENNSTEVTAGDTVPLGPNSNFGSPVQNGDQVIVRWDDGNQTKRLGNYTAGN